MVLGTRPEAIKLAPVVRELRRHGVKTTVIATAQHREMLDQMLERFEIVPDIDLGLMQPGQELGALTARLMGELGEVIEALGPTWVLVQGDTTSAFVGALAGFYAGAQIGHVEAGLRTGDLRSPYPEEANRKLITTITDVHFCPTPTSQRNLLREGVKAVVAPVVGNTVIDSLQWALSRVSDEPSYFRGVGRKRLLVTLHRRESHGEIVGSLAATIRRLTDDFGLEVVFPVHRNPRVREPIVHALAGHPSIALTDPLDYFALVKAMSECDLILTDSGGIQEEAPTLGKPVLVLRQATERPEGIEAGGARLVGTGPERVYAETRRLLEDENAYQEMAHCQNPYGDGLAASRIVQHLQTRAPREVEWRASIAG